MPGELLTFIFEDFILTIYSVKVVAKADLQDVYITHQYDGQQLASLDQQWQHGDTLLNDSMTRNYGITNQRV
ncbi:gfo/Idh/MocA family oxidoreductase, partial [Vibrio parahaemolyticus]|nr:gfo/Idh/MocA family oxidoreductase [Vibrio parahaemolyticus]